MISMRRRKCYILPRNVRDIVIAICQDYDRRAQTIPTLPYDSAVRAQYEEFNAIVDRALSLCEDGIRRRILEDITGKRGYDSSFLSSILAKNTYYSRKKQVIYEIAVGLKLI